MVVSKVDLQTDTKTSRGRKRGTGEQAGEVDDVQAIGEIDDVGLNPNGRPLGPEHDGADRRVNRC